ncbi:MAG: hypothetical protein IJ094_13120 [Bacilli bacterium]|nr:hypothetical protein [Bacilli bacterium]
MRKILYLKRIIKEMIKYPGARKGAKYLIKENGLIWYFKHLIESLNDTELQEELLKI